MASGQMLLQLRSGSFEAEVAFSPDGRRVAVGSVTAFNPGTVDVWDLENGRGIRSLRGLVGPISKVCFSRDGRLLAALAHDWQAAIWDLGDDRLLHVFEVPHGLVADNAALTFCPEGRRFAFSSGHEARLWDVASGEDRGAWRLYEGLCDVLAFTKPDELISLRVETPDGSRGPYSNAPPAKYPRVVRIRNLLGPTPTKPVAEITEFSGGVGAATAPPDGSYFVIDGFALPGGQQRKIKIYDAGGKELGNIVPGWPTLPGAQLTTDPSGRFLGVRLWTENRIPIVRTPSQEVHAMVTGFPEALSPGAEYWANGAQSPGGLSGMGLFRTADPTPLVVLGVDVVLSESQQRFDASGRLLAWGNVNGSVCVCDVREVRRRLAELDLGW